MLALGSIAPRIAGEGPPGPGLICFFKVDCPACHLALRCLDTAARRLGVGAEVIGISQDDPDPTAELAQSLAICIPTRSDLDLRGSVAYGLEAVPAIFVLDAQGRVAARSQGFDRADLERLSRHLADLAGVPDPGPLGARGIPDFQPGCVSRHLEPDGEGAVAAPLDLYARRSGRASRVPVPQGTDLHEWCYEQGFADPLPVVPPTADRVDAMTSASGRPADEILAHVPPNYAPASVEKLAANAVMAGCRPEYMRVLVPALRALCDERLDIHGVQGTTHFAAPLAIINGPVRLEMGFACGSNVFSNAARANSTIGRALQLVLRNIGGAAPGRIDMSTLGNPGRFSYVIGENEEASPWDPLATDFGIAPGRNAVTFFCAEPPRAVSEHKARRGAVLLRAVCAALANVWSRRTCGRSEALVVIGPEHAATLGRDGFTKTDVVGFLHENTGIPVAEYDGDGGEGTHEAGSYEECIIRGVRCYRKFRGPAAIRVMVAGGPAGKFSAVLGSWASGPRGSQIVSYGFD